MEREYDIFEQFPDGFPLWRNHVRGLREATRMLRELAASTANECFTVHLPTKEIIARLNVRSSGPEAQPLIFQIGYGSNAAIERAALLRKNGYEVSSVFGNDAAKLVLQMTQGPIGLFIVGHSAPAEMRQELVVWLKTGYPKVPVLALHSRDEERFASADHNAAADHPETWLPFVSSILGPGSKSSAAPPGKDFFCAPG